MSDGLTYEKVVELLPAYSLSALDPDDLSAMDAYLQQHHALLERVERLDVATGQLAYAAPVVPMSPHLKSTLMTQIRAEAIPARTMRLLNVAEHVTQNLPTVPKNTPLLPARQQEQSYPLVRSLPVHTSQPLLPPQPPSRRFDFGWLAAAAMAVAALFIIWIDFGAQRQLLQLQGELVSRDSQVVRLSQQLQVMEDQLQQNQHQMAFFTNASAIVALNGTANAPGAGGVFYQRNEEALLVLSGLPPLPAGQSYQIWLIAADGKPASAGLLAVQSAGINRLQLSLPVTSLAYTIVGISIEPENGSPALTGTLVLLGEKS